MQGVGTIKEDGLCLGTGSYVAGSRVEELLSRVLVDELSVMNTPAPANRHRSNQVGSSL